MNNLKQLKQLIKKYESISIEDINKVEIVDEFQGHNVAYILTGFGNIHGNNACILCTAVEGHCFFCIYRNDKSMEDTSVCFCLHGMLKESYEAIRDTNSPESLYLAFQNRANVLKKFIKDNKLTNRL